MTRALEERLRRGMARATRTSEGCLIWRTAGQRYAYSTDADGRQRPAHRLVYEQFVGPIPPDHDIDHLCGTKGCVEPTHLEPATRSENLKRWYRANWNADIERPFRPVTTPDHRMQP